MPPAPLTTGQVAKMTSVNINVVKRWISEGYLEAYRLPSKHHRISPTALRTFLLSHNMPVPSELEPAQKKILIIDDSENQRTLLQGYLEAAGQYDIQHAEDGYDGLIQIGSFQPDILFLDIMMPDMDGLTLLRSLGKICSPEELRIIVVTGSHDTQTLKELDELSPDAIVRKPYLFEEIDQVLQSDRIL